MPKLWMYSENQWNATPPAGEAFSLGDAGAQLVRCGAQQNVWALLVAPHSSVRINGERVPLGIRALADRDAIQIGAADPVFFSTQEAASVVSFSKDRAVPCARCKNDIKPGDLSVQCPRCGAWHHQKDDLACWNYADTCAGCGGPTNECGEWSPLEL